MSYQIIEKPPENFPSNFVKVHGTDCREEFLKTISGFFKNIPYIYTDVIPLEWATAAMKFSKDSIHYSFNMQKAQVNFGETGTAHGIFYFVRKPVK